MFKFNSKGDSLMSKATSKILDKVQNTPLAVAQQISFGHFSWAKLDISRETLDNVPLFMFKVDKGAGLMSLHLAVVSLLIVSCISSAQNCSGGRRFILQFFID